MSETDKPEAFKRFENFVRAIVRVPKKEIGEQHAEAQKAKTADDSKKRRRRQAVNK